MRYISLLLLFVTGFATELSPWFPPPFVFEGRFSFFFEQIQCIQTPTQSFPKPTNNSSVHLSLNITPWPNWNVEAELIATHTHITNFAIEAGLATVRYSCFDDINGDPVSWSVGATFTCPSHPFLHQFSFPYHGSFNTEFHTTLGKEWALYQEWIFRLWGLGGVGVANRGSSWLHGLMVAESKTSPANTVGIFVDTLYGLGNQSLRPNISFKGYSTIAHRNIDLGGFCTHIFPYWGMLSLLGWYNIYAYNFAKSYWGCGISFVIPFSVF